MTRSLLLVAVLSLPVFAQVGLTVRWTCPKDGRFSVKHCEGCNPHYCMDGQHFHADEGPVPAWVLNHFAELKRRSQEIRAGIDARSAELRANHAANVERSKQRNARYAAEHEAFLRRVQSGQNGTGPRLLSPAPASSGVVEAAPGPVAPLKAISRSELEQIRVGDTRGDIVGLLGTPASAITIPGDDGTVETLSYRVSSDRTARINLRHGRVVEISLPQF